MTKNPASAELWARVQQLLREDKKQQRAVLDDIASRIFDTYRTVLGDEFTVRKALHLCLNGESVAPKQWDALPAEARDVLDVLGAKSPSSIDTERLSTTLADAVRDYFDRKGQPLTHQQQELVPAMTGDMLTALERIGFSSTNNVRQPYIPGLKQLVIYHDFLVFAGQWFMNDYDTERIFTANAIKAHQQVLLQVLKVAGNVKVDYGWEEQLVKGIKTLEWVLSSGSEGQLVVKYTTHDKKEGRIDVLKGHITAPEQEKSYSRLLDLLYQPRIESTGEHLMDLGMLYVVAGKSKPANLATELHANELRGMLRRVGIDFSQKASAVLSPDGQQTVKFFYEAVSHGRPTGALVGAQFRESEHTLERVFVCTPEALARERENAARVDELHATPEWTIRRGTLEPISIKEYLNLRERGDGLSYYSSERRRR